MGAVFSGGGAVVSYDDGVQAAASGTTGTQRNEFEAAIKSVTSSTTVGAVFLYSTKDDSDGGAWRKKCKGLSWFDEGSSATRSARSEFPAMALIVADNASSPTVTIYDLDDPAMPMWMVFSSEASGGENHFWRYGDATSIAALNGRIIVGKTSGGGSCEFRFVEDKTWNNGTSGTNQMLGGIVDRNSGLSWGTVDASRTTVNNQHNDVAMTVLEGAEIGALGLPIPTVAVATAGGCSVILANSTVNNSSSTAPFTGVKFDDKGVLFIAYNASTDSWVTQCEPSVYHTDGGNFNVSYFTETAHSGATSYIPNFVGSDPKIANLANDGLAVGTDSALNLYKINKGDTTESSLATVTSTYNTGYMVGDIRFAGLAGNGTADEEREDRSVNGNDLTETGTITSAEVATSAELYAYSGFSSSNHLTRAYDADFDFTDGKFSVMCWVKVVASATYQSIANRYSASDTGKGWFMYINPTEQVYLQIYGVGVSGNTAALSDGWHFICAVSDGATISIYADGALGNSATFTAGDLSNTAASLHIGIDSDLASYPQLGSLSLFRISATVPTPQQIADIYAAEKPLFAAGAKCLLQSGNNAVSGLAYDKSTSLLTVAQSIGSGAVPGATIFRGLEQVATFNGKAHDSAWSGYTISEVSSAGGVSVYSRQTGSAGGTILDLPALDVRAELNEGESKIPDDGKLHFEGVTSDGGSTTPITIGHIPVAEGDAFTITAKVRGNEYNDVDGEHCYYEVTRSFYRDTGDAIDSPTSTLGDVIARTATITVSDEATATMDFVLEPAAVSGGPVATTGIPNKKRTVILKSTGVANKRMVWKASVEVQRISEKTYER